ncbi:MAG: glycosyltransferase family 39 protein [Anaerolineae bacterium]|nr:glycosyltransferase family 39 protein [Anaerolineae bacterium]
MPSSRTSITLFLALLLGNAVVLYGSLDWTWLRFPAALALTFVLPGWAWMSALDWLHTDDGIERIVLIVGGSSVLSALALLIALLLPGPFTETPNLIALDLATLSGIAWSMVTQKSKIENPRPSDGQSKIAWPSRTVWLILLAIVAVAAFTRLFRLGYAEFHEDELENMRLIVRAYKGEEYAPYLDTKGPIHWLLPAALWYLNGWVNEGIARAPFVITSILLVPMMFVLGRRMSGGRAGLGLLAAGFVAVNGFYVAYARFVENQSLIVLWGALAVWLGYRWYKEGTDRFLFYTAVILAVGLIAHPDVLLYLPVFVYLVWLKMRQGRLAWSWAVGAALLFGGLVALFYVPYFLDPEIGLVYQYFAGERIGEGLFYNQVANLFDQDQLYSSRYHALVLVLLLFWLLLRQFARWHGWGWLAFAGLSLAIISTVAWPALWQVGSLNLAFVPYAGVALLLILSPQTAVEIKVIFLWFIVPLGALLFLAKDAADHVQVAYTGWALLAAFALLDLWAGLKMGSQQPATQNGASIQVPRLPSTIYRLLRSAVVLCLALAIALIICYQYLAFNAQVTTYWRAKADSAANPDSIYNLLYGDLPRPRKIFSNPRLGGWKAAGYLWASGKLSGDFRSVNESFAVPVWYTLQTPRSCYDDPHNYWVRNDLEGWPEEEQAIMDRGYTLTRVVLVDQEPMLHLYEKNAAPRQPEVLDVEAYRHAFDRLTTPARMARDEIISQPASLNFGDKLLLRGYDAPPSPAHPGDLLPVTVYWESLAPMEIRYRGFVHLVGPNDTRWGQHDDDPACRLLTTEMRPGQRSSRQFRLPVDPATPPGNYQIVFGLYDPATLQRLPVWDNLAGRSPGDRVVLGQLTITN